MTSSASLPTDHPMMIAWTAYKATDEYRNTLKWAAHEQHVEGSLWAAYEQGFRTGGSSDLSSAKRADHDGEHSDEGLWSWLTEQRGLEVTFGWKEEEPGEWQVHRVNGGVNDREWTLIASGETVLEAVRSARDLLQGPNLPPTTRSPRQSIEGEG